MGQLAIVKRIARPLTSHGVSVILLVRTRGSWSPLAIVRGWFAESAMRVHGFRLGVGLGLISIASALALAQADKGLEDLADRYWDATMERYPTRATALGDYRFNDRLEDVSETGRRRWKDGLNGLLTEVRRLDKKGLSASDRLTGDLLERAITDELLRLQCLEHHTPLEPMHGPHIQFPLLLVSQPFRSAADFRAYVARLRAFPEQVTDLIANMRMGRKLGLVSPRAVVEKVVPQIRTHIVRDPRESEFYEPVRKASALSEADREVVVAGIVDAIESDVIPAYLQLAAFVEDEYLPNCRSTVGVGSLPSGSKLYDALAYLSMTVRLTPDDVHELGRSEVERIRGEFATVRTEIGFEGTLAEFLALMRDDPRHRFQSREELIAAADAILQRTQALLPRLFGRLPKAKCVMKEMEAFRAASSPMAYYNAPPVDGSRPAYYYINTHAPRQRVKFTLEALTYHEAVPGHHLQISLCAEDTTLPQFRRHGYHSAFGEGWALYAEKLGYAIGGYETPERKFGQLTFEMLRACRLVVDTGLHHKGWPRQEAIDYMVANTSLAIREIETEVDRYIAWPGQALSYKIGELSILQMRGEAERLLGDRFDLRAFHDALLGEGSMPLDLLGRHMRDWVISQQP